MEKKGAQLKNDNFTNHSGIASVILGILSLVFSLTLFLGAIGGFILGIIGLFFAIKQIKVYKNRWSTAGLILCIFGILLNLLVLGVMIALFIELIKQFQLLSSSEILPTA